MLGKDKIAIGISKRKKVSGLVPFEKLDLPTRHLEMLNWFVDKNVASIAVSGNGLISETAIENNPNNIHCAVLDNYLAIDDLQKYFEDDGWAALQQVVGIKRTNPIWILCISCNKDSSNNSICCNR
ncbi:protein FAR-RED ELONGATED HYPOCOTYL 3-like [Aphis craccivora]|uniref:Protein FAR-RED ELONGATED HYPOCOTYL 3-like n=1 Tax=Aphis craccivora TaxID=307492 RepID=A0A6G0XLW2_APHCR|nr:protein FAR-RED ELONGATED HYPOCOTYL 3-like [Aphis craccivora]